jgi:hypothetical protein
MAWCEVLSGGLAPMRRQAGCALSVHWCGRGQGVWCVPADECAKQSFSRSLVVRCCCSRHLLMLVRPMRPAGVAWFLSQGWGLGSVHLIRVFRRVLCGCQADSHTRHCLLHAPTQARLHPVLLFSLLLAVWLPAACRSACCVRARLLFWPPLVVCGT